MSDERQALVAEEGGVRTALPLRSKAAFGAGRAHARVSLCSHAGPTGGALTALTSTVIGFYASPFFLEVAQVRGAVCTHAT